MGRDMKERRWEHGTAACDHHHPHPHPLTPHHPPTPHCSLLPPPPSPPPPPHPHPLSNPPISPPSGDPASALLEVLDPEQNAAFTDTYLALPFPLDAVVFLCTANRLEEVPAPLLDRLEVIPVSGYTLHEKVAIARTHVLPKVVQEHGLAEGSVDVTDALIGAVVEGYTREAGVRGLGRCLAALCRHVAVARATAMDAREGAGEGGKGVKGKGEGTAEVVRHTRDRLREVLGGGGSPLVGAGEGEGEGEGKGEGGEREGKGKGMGAEEGPFVVTEEVVAQVLGPRRFTGPEVR